MTKKVYKLGVDVGGTNTDAIILDNTNNVIAATKSPTTEQVEVGIINSIKQTLAISNIKVEEINLVSLGTTHATNAIIRREDLSKVGIVRICLPAGKGVPPLANWDESLIESMGAKSYFIHGGFEYDGRSLADKELNKEECKKVLDEMERDQVESIAISCIFSPVQTKHEEDFAKLVYERFGEDFPVTMSSEIGSLGLLERENSTILNASLVGVAEKTAKGLVKALEDLNINSKVFFAQNDGTLMTLEYAMRYPVLTIGSGPTNSTRGAAYLSELDDCIVVDIGGTSTDVGILVNGFPRQSAVAVEVGGVLTNFRMPDLISIGLGGGSIVRFDGDDVQVGPNSVGYKIKEKAICFGGDTLTATDIAIASGVAQIDDPDCDPSRLSHLSEDLVEKAMNKISELIYEACEKIKTSPDPIQVVLVGGGSIIMPSTIKGVDQYIKPTNFECANAIGAAIAEASGEVDALFPLENTTREEIINQAKKEAIQKSIEMGSSEEDTKIVDIEAVPLSYLPGNVLRVKAKAAGSLQI